MSNPIITFHCPECGASLQYQIVPLAQQITKRGWLERLFNQQEFESSHRWEPSIAQPTIPVTVRPLAPPANPLIPRHIWLPLGQALISGFFAAWVPTLITLYFAWKGDIGLGWPPAVFVISFPPFSGVCWFVLFVRDRRVLDFLERLTGVDLNRDGSIGSPPPEPPVHRGEFTDRERRQQIIVPEMPVSISMMRRIAHAMLKEGGRWNFSRRDMMAAAGISDGKFEELQAIFLEKQWAAYKTPGKPNAGVKLRTAGEYILRTYLENEQDDDE